MLLCIALNTTRHTIVHLFTCSLSLKLQLDGKLHRDGDLGSIYLLLYPLHLGLCLEHGRYSVYDILKEEENIICLHILGKICKILFFFFLATYELLLGARALKTSQTDASQLSREVDAGISRQAVGMLNKAISDGDKCCYTSEGD